MSAWGELLRQFVLGVRRYYVYQRGTRQFSRVYDTRNRRWVRRPQIHIWERPRVHGNLRLEVYRNNRTAARWMQCRDIRTGHYVACPWVTWEYRVTFGSTRSPARRRFTLILRGKVRNTPEDTDSLEQNIDDIFDDAVSGIEYDFLFSQGFPEVESRELSLRSPTSGVRFGFSSPLEIRVIDDMQSSSNSYTVSKEWEYWLG